MMMTHTWVLGRVECDNNQPLYPARSGGWRWDDGETEHQHRTCRCLAHDHPPCDDE